MPAVLDVHPSHAERARAYVEDPSGFSVVTPRTASTVVLLRDAARGPEVHLLRRAGSMAFAAGMHVFPGGSVDPRDSDRGPRWAGPDAATWAERLGCDEPLARALVIAAARETFEESAVLLAGPDDTSVVGDTSGTDLESARLALLNRSLSMSDLLGSRGLVLRADLMRPLAHWVTPEFEPKRFDTWFFVAGVPTGQQARDVSGEADATSWLPVRDAVRRHDEVQGDGHLLMLPPTIEALRSLVDHDTVTDALEALALARRPGRLPRILPRPVWVDGRLVLDLDEPVG